jgi:transposase InsO family protein
MTGMRLCYPIALTSRILKVSANGFYAWMDRPTSELEKEEKRLELEINATHRRAVTTGRPENGLLHHSDRGQYCSHEYQSLLSKFALEASTSGTGNCFDNAPMESFWGIIRQELIHHCHYRTRQEAIEDISEYIEIFYN